jgi:hypothetical protein
LGLLESMVLKVLEQRFWHNVTYRKQTQAITQKRLNKHVLYECTERKRK